MRKIPEDYIEYFRKTNKHISGWKTMPESYKVILNHISEHEWNTAFSLMCIYNSFKDEVKDKELRKKELREIYFELNELLQRGFLESVIINDKISDKIIKLQSMIDV